MHLRAAVVVLSAIGVLGISTPPASALNCGAKDQPVCTEVAPPGAQLTLTADQNPHGLQPLSVLPAPDRPLWEPVHGHKPYGFNAGAWGFDGVTMDEEAFLHQEIGASMTRIGADWGMVQYHPNWDAGGRPWNYERYLDPQYKAFVRRGIRPMLTISKTPRRFTNRADTIANSNVAGCGTSDACWNPPRAQDLDHLAVFAADLARRYPLAAGIELWNEPNLSNPFWGSEDPDPEHYTKMLERVHDAVKSVNPNLPVIAGALTNSRSDGQSAGRPLMGMKNFLRRMLLAGAQPKMDAVSIHPYLGNYPTWTDDPSTQNQILLNSLDWTHRDLKGGYVESGKEVLERVVMSEYGASTRMGWTESKRSDWLVYQFHLWDVAHTRYRLSERVDGAFVHHTVENGHDGDPLRGYGFTARKDSSGSFAPHPVFCGYREVFAPALGACPASLKATG